MISGVLYGDNIKLNQVLSNLVTNAIDSYNDNDMRSRRIVSVKSSLDILNTAIIITVTDFGIGIPKDKVERIFDPFYTTKTCERGTGIGLTITRRIIQEDFKGTISVQSSKLLGTVFTVRLPLSASSK